MVPGADSKRSSTARSRCCSGMPAWPRSLDDGFVSRGGTGSATAGTLKERGLDRAAISLPQPEICPLAFLSPTAERGQSPPCQHAVKLQYLNQSSLPAERDGNVMIR